MAEFKRKPMPAAELTEALRSHASGLPSATGQQILPPSPQTVSRGGEGRGVPKAPPTVQCNFNCTIEMADLIAEEAEKAGSTRRFFARLMRNAGFTVPEADIFPLDLRRRARRGP
jgi:hypothetical protein